MIKYKTLKSEEIKFGKGNFIQVARKKAITPETEREFISVSRGFLLLNGQKRYKQSLTVPDSKEVVDFISKNLKKML